MRERTIEKGDIVVIKPEWLDAGESGTIKYVVLETMEDGRIRVQPLGTRLALPPVYDYDETWVSYAGSLRGIENGFY